MSEKGNRIPVIALRGLVVMPGTVVHFDISRDRSIAAVEDALAHGQMAMLLAQKNPDIEDPDVADLFEIGTVAKIRQIVRLPRNVVRVLAEGMYRARVVEAIALKPYLYFEVQREEDEEISLTPEAAEGMVSSLREIIGQYVQIGTKISSDIEHSIKKTTDPSQLINELAAKMPLKWEDRQALLEESNLKERHLKLCSLLLHEYEVLKIQQEIQEKVKARLEKNQREYVLREQLKTVTICTWIWTGSGRNWETIRLEKSMH